MTDINLTPEIFGDFGLHLENIRARKSKQSAALKYYNAALNQLLAEYGFVENPLDCEQVAQCFYAGLDTEQAYLIACDVACGFRFSESFNLTLKG